MSVVMVLLGVAFVVVPCMLLYRRVSAVPGEMGMPTTGQVEVGSDGLCRIVLDDDVFGSQAIAARLQSAGVRCELRSLSEGSLSTRYSVNLLYFWEEDTELVLTVLRDAGVNADG